MLIANVEDHQGAVPHSFGEKVCSEVDVAGRLGPSPRGNTLGQIASCLAVGAQRNVVVRSRPGPRCLDR